MLPVVFHVNSGEFRSSPDPELTGSGWICRGQRVVLSLLVLLLLVVVVLLVVWLGVASRFPRQFQRVPANSGPGADMIWVDQSGAAGCFVVVGVAVVGGGGVVGGVVGCYQSVSTSIPASSGQFRARS